MKKYNFDAIIDRRNSYSAKWNNLNKNIIPLSVADMDIMTPDFILDEIINFTKKGVCGYTLLSNNWNQLTVNWYQRHYKWRVDPEHVVFCPRVIEAISLYIQNFTQKNDCITLLSPSYSPISQSILVNERQLLESKLIYQNNQYNIDFNDLEEKFKQSVCFLLLSPHNPTGTIWSEDDLTQIAYLAEKNNVFIISDDVHADFIFSSKPYINISGISPYVEQNSFICTSPAKTFNLAGLEISNIVIANTEHRNKFKHCLIASGFHNPNYYAVPAYIAAYTHGDDWLIQLKAYIEKNRLWVIEKCNKHFPKWSITNGGGTYMLWINYQKMNISEQQLKYWFIQLANIEVSFGSVFGFSGDGFFRINVATSRLLLSESFDRLIKSFPYNK